MVRIIKGKPVLGRGGALILLVVLGGLNRMASKDQYSHSTELPNAVRSIDSGVALLRQGDLVLRKGKDITSYMLSESNKGDKTFSHCGLVQIENGHPFVYHYIGGDPGQGMHRDSAAKFFSPRNNNVVGIRRYTMTLHELAEQSRLIQQYYNSKLRFDMDFDLGSSDKMYCAEFVYRVMNAVKADTGFIGPAKYEGFAYVPVENLYRDGKASRIWQMAFK